MTRVMKIVTLMALMMIAFKPVYAKSKKRSLQAYIETQCKKACVDVKTLKQTVKVMSRKHHVPSNLILAIIKVESRFKRTALSKGNYGLMQVNHHAHRDRVKHKNLYNVQENVDLGASILKACLVHQRGLIGALTCYKGGHSRVYQSEVHKAMLAMAQLNQ